ncbi:hypothetical protein EPUL_006472, partial [Erysiphe pulchra]
ALRDRLLSAVEGVPECTQACLIVAPTSDGLVAQLRQSITTAVKVTGKTFTNKMTQSSTVNDLANQFYTDRRYHNNINNFRNQPSYQKANYTKHKKCWVCHREGCFSTKHPKSERDKKLDDYRGRIRNLGRKPNDTKIRQHLAQIEGKQFESEEDENEDENVIIEALLSQMDFLDDDDLPESSQFYTAFGDVDGYDAISSFHQQSSKHALTASSCSFLIEDRYSNHNFQGIMIDTGAARWSTAGEAQVQALKAQRTGIQIDRSTAGQVKVQFGIGVTTSIGSITLPTVIGNILFQVLPSDTPFLLSIKDMDSLGVKFDNLRNVLVHGKNEIPVIRKFGHPFLLLEDITASSFGFNDCYLTETELRRLHRRLGHPSTARFVRVLKRSGHND